MKANRRRRFTAPRLLKEPEKTRQSESDEDDIPFSVLKEKVVSERQGSDSDGDDIPFSQKQTRLERPVRGKGKGIKLLNEREADETAKFGEPLRWSDDEDRDEVPMAEFAQCLKTTGETPIEESASMVDNESLATSNEQHEDKNTQQVVSPDNMKGVNIARDFRKNGVYYGEVVHVEYDSEDEDKVFSIPAPP
jgi:hypothetical protein